MNPLVSVCIPVFNGARTIERALRSVLEESGLRPGEVEVVVCDDRSTDETLAVLAHWAGDARVRVVENERNLGLTGNWQHALSLARAPIATLLHMDDWYAPGCLGAVVARFAEEPTMVLLAMGQEHRLPTGERIDKNPNWHAGTWSGAEYFYKQLELRDCPAPSMTFFRRSALERLERLYDASYRWCPELDLYLRLAEAHPDARFVHDGRRLVLRGASRSQFSFRYPGLSILDTCTAMQRYLPKVPEERQQACRSAAQRSIALDLLALLRLHDPRQTLMVASHPAFRGWLAANPTNALGVARTTLRTGAAAMGRRILKRRTQRGERQ